MRDEWNRRRFVGRATVVAGAAAMAPVLSVRGDGGPRQTDGSGTAGLETTPPAHDQVVKVTHRLFPGQSHLRREGEVVRLRDRQQRRRPLEQHTVADGSRWAASPGRSPTSGRCGLAEHAPVH